MSTVLCNSGPLIALGKLNRLDLLVALYGEVEITRAVHNEVVSQGLTQGAPDARTVHLFWQRQRWPIVDVPPTVLSAGEFSLLWSVWQLAPLPRASRIMKIKKIIR